MNVQKLLFPLVLVIAPLLLMGAAGKTEPPPPVESQPVEASQPNRTTDTVQTEAEGGAAQGNPLGKQAAPPDANGSTETVDGQAGKEETGQAVTAEGEPETPAAPSLEPLEQIRNDIHTLLIYVQFFVYIVVPALLVYAGCKWFYQMFIRSAL